MNGKSTKSRGKENRARYKTDSFIRNQFFSFSAVRRKACSLAFPTSLQASKLRDGEKNQPREQNNNDENILLKFLLLHRDEKSGNTDSRKIKQWNFCVVVGKRALLIWKSTSLCLKPSLWSVKRVFIIIAPHVAQRGINSDWVNTKGIELNTVSWKIITSFKDSRTTRGRKILLLKRSAN